MITLADVVRALGFDPERFEIVAIKDLPPLDHGSMAGLEAGAKKPESQDWKMWVWTSAKFELRIKEPPPLDCPCDEIQDMIYNATGMDLPTLAERIVDTIAKKAPG